MKTLALVLALLITPLAHAQETEAPEGSVVQSAEVSGLNFDRLSPGLRQDITALSGQALNQERLRELAARIEGEQPEMIAAVRSVLRPDGGVRVVFLVARIGDDGDLSANINARYTVESVEIAGVPEAEVSQALRDEIQALVGKRLEPAEAERLDGRLLAELPGYAVRRRISRGSKPGQIRVIFGVAKIEPPPWIPFAAGKSKAVFHGDQGWSGALDIPVGDLRHRVTVGLVFGNDDDLIEEYSGYGFRVESRKLATDRLGASLEVSKSHQSWRDVTLSALASNPFIPEAYRTRLTVEPLATFAFSRRLQMRAGVSISELGSLARTGESQMASAAVFGISYGQRWAPTSEPRDGAAVNSAGYAGVFLRIRRDIPGHVVGASYQLRRGTDALGSDLDYTSQTGRARYAYDQGHNQVTAAVAFGRITGRAPLFERFSLGDSSTLRGWNKFDVAPVGGDNMFHQSIEYAYRHVAFFVDSGSVWQPGEDARVRVSTGFGYHDEGAFVTVGFPLNADHVSATFMAGVRF